MKITNETKVVLHPLKIKKDQKHYIVEDVLSGEYYEMPQICIDAIHFIQEGRTLGEVEALLKNNFPEEDVQVLDFAHQLLDLHLVKEIDGEEVSVEKSNVVKNSFRWIHPKFGQLFFNRWSIYGYGMLFLVNILILILNHQLTPSYKDIFIFDIMTMNIFLWLLISFCSVMIHEFGHVLAARAYDLPTTMNLGHRLFFVVFETDLSRAWSLAPKDRNVLYLAGMCFDQVLLFVALVGQMLMPNAAILAIVVLDVFMRTAFQCCFYMKTDIYYVFENITGCYNLMENGKRNLRKWIPFTQSDEQLEAFNGEQRVVTLYSLFYLVGVGITMLLFMMYYIPQAIYAFNQTLPHFVSMELDTYFWDSFLFIGQFCLMFGFLIYSWMKNSRLHEKA